MAGIIHCGATRRTKKYYLTPSAELAGFCDFEVLQEAFCPKCTHTILEHCLFRYEHGFAPSRKIRQKEVADWLVRIQTDFRFVQEAGHKPVKDATVIVFAGEYTLRIAKGADRCR